MRAGLRLDLRIDWSDMDLFGHVNNFRRPLFYPGTVSVETVLAFIKRSSFGYRHVLRGADGHVAAEAADVIVMYDYVQKRVIPFPDHLKPAPA